MSLEKYRSKRDFSKTREPSGKKNSKPSTQHTRPLRFFIQKHWARRFHYDLRLELNGVLVSFAVPKGPSSDPSDKRLAIHVEDHPLEYGNFEGTIPKGEYGAGEVIVWDKGTYSAVGAKNRKDSQRLLNAQFKKGEVKFVLSGKKIKGMFVLIKLKSREANNQWLLIKKKDNFSKTPGKVIEVNFQDKKISKKTIKKNHDPMPHLIKPELATLIENPFDDKDWIFEIKWDGYRAIAEWDKKKVELYSRNLLDFKSQFPDIVEELKKIDTSVVFDGEIVIIDKTGKSQFQLLQNYINMEKIPGVLKYIIFDLLYYDGKDLRNNPLIERKAILKSLLTERKYNYLKYGDYYPKNGIDFFKQAKKLEIEGIVAKKKDALYFSKRTRDWLKIKDVHNQEFVIGGFTAPKGGRKKLGALLLGVYKNNHLMLSGKVGGGFNQKSLNEIYEKLVPLIQEKSPFFHLPVKYKTATWVNPKLVAEVSFREWTREGILRQPVFKGLRPDKNPKEVIREFSLNAKPKPPKIKEKSSNLSKKVTLQKLNFITNPDKIYWPEENYTKGDLLDYYESVSKYLLPHLKDRPLMMHRFPDGITGKDFFQKDAPYFIPKWIETVAIQHEHKVKKVKYILVQNIETLLYVVNLGTIELHPFLSSTPHLKYPDYMVLDLDPEHIAFERVVEVAQVMHDLLEDLRIPSYCKTSGKRGLHIFIPLGAKYSFDESKNCSELLANIVHQSIPKISSVVRDPAKRQEKVYIDFLQNGRTKSVVAPYSVRPVAGACVSTPLLWSEVNKKLDPAQFTIKTVPERLDLVGDIFKPTLKKGINIQTLLRRLGGFLP